MIRLRRVAVLCGMPAVLLGSQGQPALDPGARRQDLGRPLSGDRGVPEDRRVREHGGARLQQGRRAAPCGRVVPSPRMAWRPLPPGVYRGFWESYKAEIAAYELDKLLKLDMVPPTVERQLQGNKGAAQLWVENVFGLKAGASPGESNRADWEDQLVRMTMFDDLIGNRDRNQGNMLRDAAWNLILLDHSRAFGAGTELPHKLSRIDEGFWARIESLTRASARRGAARVAWRQRDQGHPRPPRENEGRDQVAAEIGAASVPRDCECA